MMNERNIDTIIKNLEWCLGTFKMMIRPNKINADDSLNLDLEVAMRSLPDGGISILEELVLHELQAAFKRDDMDIKRNALLAYRELTEGKFVEGGIPDIPF